MQKHLRALSAMMDAPMSVPVSVPMSALMSHLCGAPRAGALNALVSLILLIALMAVVLTVPPARAQSLRIELDALSGNGWSAQKARIALTQGESAQLDLVALHAQGRAWGDVSLSCGRFAFEAGVIQCEDGRLQGAQPWPLRFSYDTRRKQLTLALFPEPGESWQLDVDNAGWRLQLANAALTRITAVLPLVMTVPKESILPNAGRMSGSLRQQASRMDADLRIADAGFADTTGLRAGEKLQGRLSFAAVHGDAGGAARTPQAPQWAWQATLHWDQGAVFWSPLYLALEPGAPGHRLTARGSYAGEWAAPAARMVIDQAVLDWAGIGRLNASADFAPATPAAGRFSLTGQGLQLAGVRALLPQTWLDEHGLGDLRIAGTGSLALRSTARRIEHAALTLAAAAIHAPQRGLALDGLTLQWAHTPERAQPFTLAFNALRLRDLAFGPVSATGETRDGRLLIPSLAVPVLDGFLGLAEIDISRDAFALQGALTPVSMDKLTTALGWHALGGQLSFVLPRVHYRASTLAVDGALMFKVFDGDASVDAIRIQNPFGRTPQLTANVRLERLDLEKLTGAVKFGSITGLADLHVEGLVMENWQPVRMDARVHTSAGPFARRISQRAVQNISTIGGAGAGAAIGRSFLGFFESFGYERIGLSCRLRNGICMMGDGSPLPPEAAARDASGGFTLIKGGGLPSVNVVGYNRFVGWDELLDRIKAVIDGNSRPVFQ